MLSGGVHESCTRLTAPVWGSVGKLPDERVYSELWLQVE